MTHEIMLGMVDLAESIRPHGLECYARTNCSARTAIISDIAHKIVTGPLRNATQTQKKLFKNKREVFFILPTEIYGHVLLFLERFSDAKKMFEQSLLDYGVGKAISLLGLARSHLMLGNTKKATFFYKYLRDQYSKADKDNPVVKEADSWITERKIEELFWPYFSPESTEPIQKKGE